MVDIFKDGKFELLALTETKFKGKGVVPWWLFRRWKELGKGWPPC